MSLWILPNQWALHAMSDLRTICPDPGLTFDLSLDAQGFWSGTGQVSYVPTMSSVGCELVGFLVSHPCWIGIRGESWNWTYGPRAGENLQIASGVTVYDALPSSIVDIAYDPSECNRRGRWVQDGAGNHIGFSPDVLLFHELAHARHACEGVLIGLDNVTAETLGILEENNYRTSLGLPERVGHFGGCSPVPTIDCFVATAAYGSPLEPEVRLLRAFRDGVLRKTRTGAEIFSWFYSRYSRVSPLVVRLMKEDPEVQRMVRIALVSPIVNYLKIALDFPNAPTENIEEPWKSFLSRLRDSLDEWAEEVGIPLEFRDLPVESAVDEVALILRYGLRGPAAREEYLLKLERLGQIPLTASKANLEDLRMRLSKHGVEESTVRRVLGEDR